MKVVCSRFFCPKCPPDVNAAFILLSLASLEGVSPSRLQGKARLLHRRSTFLWSQSILLGIALAASLSAQQTELKSAVAPRRLTLKDALDLARQNSVSYQAAVTEARIAHEDKKQS